MTSWTSPQQDVHLLGQCCMPTDTLAGHECPVRSHADGELSKLIKRCPVSGAELVPGDDWGNIIYMTMCMDQGSGQGLQVRRCLQTSHTPTAHTCCSLSMADIAPTVILVRVKRTLNPVFRAARLPARTLWDVTATRCAHSVRRRPDRGRRRPRRARTRGC